MPVAPTARPTPAKDVRQRGRRQLPGRQPQPFPPFARPRSGGNDNAATTVVQQGDNNRAAEAATRAVRTTSSNQSNQGGNRNRGNRGGDRRRNAVQTMQGADLTQRLPKPPKAPKDGLRLIALGGISEIGRNMTVFEYHNRIIIIDCGVLFPSSGEPGVDLILPDFSYLDDKWDRVEALVVTHGHEDHIGAIPWLLKQRADIPIIGSRFTCALIAAKCQEHRLASEADRGRRHLPREPRSLRRPLLQRRPLDPGVPRYRAEDRCRTARPHR
jgi:ribonuclease J